MTRMNIRQALRHGFGSLPQSRERQRDSTLLLCRALGKDRAWLIAHPDECLTVAEAWRYEQWLARRAAHEPMQYILEEQEFFGLRFSVSPAVLIPRPETEHLVEAALARLPIERAARIADVGTGSGAIAVAIAHSRPLAQVTGLDISPAALEVARRNAAAHGVDARVRLLASDLLAAVAAERFEMVASNPPYVPDAEALEPQVAEWEPAGALFGGIDGLSVYRRLIPEAEQALVAGGWLLMEIGHGQRQAITSLLAGWNEVSFVDDLQGIARVAVARRPEAKQVEPSM